MIIVDKSLVVDDTSLVTVASQKERDALVEATDSKFDALLQSETEKLNRNKSDENTVNLKDIFKEAAKRYGISQELLEAIGYHESRFQANATSYAGAMGIMQLMPGTAKAMGVSNAYDPYQNIMGAAKLLGYLNKLYNGDTKLVLAGYAAGTGSVAKYGGVPPYKETQQFIADIYELLDSRVFIDSSNQSTGTTTNPAVQTTTGATETTNATTTAATTAATTTATTAAAASNNTSGLDTETAVSLANAIINGTTSSTSYRNLSQSLSAAALNSLLGTGTSDNYSSNLSGLSVSSLLQTSAIAESLQSEFSYSDYELMMEYYNNMLSIISDIGSDDTSNADDDNSLSDLFSLGIQQRYGTTDSSTISTSQVNTQTMANVAAKYLANANLL